MAELTENTCEGCGDAAVVEIAGQSLCAACYQTQGSCCGIEEGGCEPVTVPE